MKPFIRKLLYVYAFCLTALFIGVMIEQDDPAITAMDQFIAEQVSAKAIDKQSENWKQSLPKPPQVAFAQDKSYHWQLVTNKGPITIELLHQYAPMHVSSTIYLTQLGFYDDLLFHRVIPGFMAQGGDPTGTGRGSPGYRYQGEFHPDASHNKAGMLSMANSGPNTDGSQFFITFKATPFLDGKHTVFGEVTAGFETLSELELFGSRGGKTQEELKILTASIVVK